MYPKAKASNKGIGGQLAHPSMSGMNWRDKKYGKLSGAELEDVLRVFSEIWADRASVTHAATEHEIQAQLLRMMAVPNWINFYQLSLMQLLGHIIAIAGLADSFMEAASSDDPRSSAIEVLKGMPDEAPDHPDALPVSMAMIGNLDAVARYSRSISEMVAALRDKGDVAALLEAISVDSYVTSMPIVQALLRIGQLSGDDSFASQIFSAVRGPHKARLSYPKLRWAEYLLRDQGAFDACSQDEIHDLVVYRLKLYDDDTRKKDSKKALFMLFRKWQKRVGN